MDETTETTTEAPDEPPAAAPISRLGVKVAAFTALVIVCAGIGVAVLINARSDDPKSKTPQEQSVIVDPAQLSALMEQPHLVFENTDFGRDYGRVEVVPLSNPRGPRALTPLTCDRVAATKNVGVCLIIERGLLAQYTGEIFDRDFKVTHKFSLPGRPSRARVSPDGHWAAMTVFVGGDTYAEANFSTRTMFVDTATGKNIGNLEGFEITDGGTTVNAVNRNYWGVTFKADSDHFYATLGRGAKVQMIEGSVSSRRAHTIRSDVECPALSPDQTRVAYKLRVGSNLSAVRWRLHVLDLNSGIDVAVGETRSVDDQVEWLDNDTVLYSILRTQTGSAIQDTYGIPADGTGQPTLYLKGAWSPSVAR